METMKKRAERLYSAISKSGLSYAELEALTGIIIYPKIRNRQNTKNPNREYRGACCPPECHAPIFAIMGRTTTKKHPCRSRQECS